MKSYAEYFAAVLVVAVILHSVIRQYAVASLATAALCSIAPLVYEAWKHNFEVKPGWIPPILIFSFVAALPPSLLGGVPRLIWRARQRRRAPLKPVKTDEFEL